MHCKHDAEEIKFDSFYESVYYAGKMCVGRTKKPTEVEAQDFTRKVAHKLLSVDGVTEIEHGSIFEHGVVLVPDDLYRTYISELVFHLVRHTGLKVPAFRDVEDDLLTTPRQLFNMYLRCYCTPDEALTKVNDAWIAAEPYRRMRRTFWVTTNIGVMRELLRHRVCSPTEKSTRLSENDLEPNVTEGEYADGIVLATAEDIALFTKMREDGIPRDVAREVLTLATKTQAFLTFWEDDIKRFVALRGNGTGAHQSARAVAESIRNIVDG